MGTLHDWGLLRVREAQPPLTPSDPVTASSHLFFFREDFSKFHLPTKVPSSDVRAQSTSSSVCILLPSWTAWSIRGSVPPTLLFQDKFSSSSSGIALSASPGKKWLEEDQLITSPQSREFISKSVQPLFMDYQSWARYQVLVPRNRENKRTQVLPTPSRVSFCIYRHSKSSTSKDLKPCF